MTLPNSNNNRSGSSNPRERQRHRRHELRGMKEWLLLLLGLIVICRNAGRPPTILKNCTMIRSPNSDITTTTTSTSSTTSTETSSSSPTTSAAAAAAAKESRRPYKTAYVTMISTDSYVPGALILWHSLNATGSIRPNGQDDFVLLDTAEPSLSEEATKKLHEVIPNLVIIPSNEIEKLDRIKSEDLGGRYKGDKSWMMFRKLNIYNLIQYDFVVYLDADIVVLKDISHLFPTNQTETKSNMNEQSHETFQVTACPEKKGLEPELQGGLLAFPPNNAVFEDMKQHINDEQYLCGFRVTDQSFQCHYFHPTHARKNKNSTTTTTTTPVNATNTNTTWLGGTWNPLPKTFMALHKAVNKNQYSKVLTEASVVHYNGDKPWLKPSKKDRLVRAWYKSARDCGTKCLFEPYLTQTMITTVLQ